MALCSTCTSSDCTIIYSYLTYFHRFCLKTHNEILQNTQNKYHKNRRWKINLIQKIASVAQVNVIIVPDTEKRVSVHRRYSSRSPSTSCPISRTKPNPDDRREKKRRKKTRPASKRYASCSCFSGADEFPACTIRHLRYTAARQWLPQRSDITATDILPGKKQRRCYSSECPASRRRKNI